MLYDCVNGARTTHPRKRPGCLSMKDTYSSCTVSLCIVRIDQCIHTYRESLTSRPTSSELGRFALKTLVWDYKKVTLADLIKSCAVPHNTISSRQMSKSRGEVVDQVDDFYSPPPYLLLLSYHKFVMDVSIEIEHRRERGESVREDRGYGFGCFLYVYTYPTLSMKSRGNGYGSESSLLSMTGSPGLALRDATEIFKAIIDGDRFSIVMLLRL